MSNDLTFPGMARDVLADLHRRLGLDAWVLTRVAGDDSMVIFAEGDLGVEEGETVPWANSLEARLADGGPWAAPDVSASPYAGAGTIIDGVAAFAGAPLRTMDGSLFGAVYGIGREVADFEEDEVSGPLGLAVRTLALVLAMEQVAADVAPSEVGAVRHDLRRDPITGVLNDRGWEEALTAESARCSRYGNAASIVQVLLVGMDPDVEAEAAAPPEDVVLRQAGDALRAWSRGADVVARTGESLFTILLVEVDEQGADRAVKRLQQTFTSRHLQARIGLADNQSRSLAEAVEVALRRAVAATPGVVLPPDPA